jgi:linoleoyl-CoA desaturase
MPAPCTTTLDPLRLRFRPSGEFWADVKRNVDAYFEGAGRRRRDVASMYLKSAIILTWFVGSWVALVFAPLTWPLAVLFAVSLGLSIAAVGASVQHDANHSAYSSHRAVNRAFGLTLDVMGVCSFIWRQRHNTIHHTYTNIRALDLDLDFGVIARLSPEQPLRPWQRYQHFYVWFLYGFLLPKWAFYDDWINLYTRQLGPHKLARFGLGQTLLFIGSKLFFITWSIVIPACFHPWWQVAVFHLITVFTLGVTLSSSFMLAHCVEEAEFPPPPADAEPTEHDWATHQLHTTVDFAPDNPVATWFLGGLSFQVEHHLFPHVCHVHYPALARIIRTVADKHGVPYRVNTTFRGALASHWRHLKKLSRSTAS